MRLDGNTIVEKAAAMLNAVEYGSPEHDVALFALWQAMPPAQREVLQQLLFHGPVWDGDIISKSARGALFTLGLAVRCCYKGEQGFTAAAYPAYTVWKAAQP